MDNKDFVTYETAKRLKEYGFHEPCDHYYTQDDAPDGQYWFVPCGDYKDWNSFKNDCPLVHPECSAPLLSVAQKWLRNVHRIDMNVDLDDDTDSPYTVEVYRDKECVMPHWELGFFTSYEAALAEGIKVALELIKPTTE